MSPELITAVKGRLARGYTHDAIRTELRGVGYSEAVIEQVLQAATGTPPIPQPGVPTPPPEAVALTALPGPWTIFKNGIRYAIERLDLVGLLMVPAVLIAIMTAIAVTSGGGGTGALALSLSALTLVVSLAYILLVAAVLRIVVSSAETRLSIAEGVTWARSQGVGWLWIVILTALVTFGGSLLFVIPGIIVSIYVYFAQYVYAKEGERGLRALLRSRELVMGNWWAVAGRLIVFGLLFFLILLVVGVLLGLLTGLAGLPVEGSEGEIIYNFFAQVINAFMVVAGLAMGSEMYRALAAKRPVQPGVEYLAGGKYRALAWLGLLFPVIGFIAAIILASLNDAHERGLQDRQYLQDALEAKERAAELRE